MRPLLISLVLLLASGTLAARPYYLSSLSGSDSADARTPSTAWRSLSTLSVVDFEPGDTVYLQAGETYAGGIYLEESDAGTPSNPVVITGWGSGLAVIDSRASFGVYAYNVSGIVLRQMSFVGLGAETSSQPGIMFYMDSARGYRDYVRIERCRVSGFREGIVIGAYHPAWGYRDVEISDCEASANRRSGISSYGTGYANRRFTVQRCVAHSNLGDSSYTVGHSGNGIVLGGIDTVLIDSCIAYNNGSRNAHLGGGPCGIWLYLCANGTIQNSESHHNRSGQDADGGGFDIDGGSRNCTIQYCYSHDNEGPGYLLAEYGADSAFRNNVIRYNISQNDARKNGNGSIVLWGVDALHLLIDCRVYNNTVYSDSEGVVSGYPIALLVSNANMNGVAVQNNIFVTRRVATIASPALSRAQLLLLANDYYTPDFEPAFYWGAGAYPSLQGWLAVAQDEERVGGTVVGRDLDPMLAGAGSGVTTGGSIDQLRARVAAYHLLPGSPMIDSGVAMVDAPAVDLFGVVLPSGQGVDVGCAEFAASVGVGRERSGAGALALSPNPAADLLTVEASALPARIELLDLRGRVVFEGEIERSPAHLTLAGVVPGTYVVRLVSAGGVASTASIVVAR